MCETTTKMEYAIIRNDGSFVTIDKNNRVCHTTDKNKCKKFNCKKVNLFLNSNIKPADRNMYSIVLLENDVDNRETMFDADDFSIKEMCESFKHFLVDAEVRKNKLIEKFKKIQAEDNDIRHRFENPKKNGKEFNAVELMKLGQMQRDVLRRRRKVGDEIKQLNAVLRSSTSDFKNGKIINCIDGFDGRKYMPRVLHELFEV